MKYIVRSATVAALAFGVLLHAPRLLIAQALLSRISAAPEGDVQFAYASRAGVCGDGRSWFTTGSGSWYGNVSVMNAGPVASAGDAGVQAECARGPVRVTLVRLAREIVDVRVQVGPLTPDERAHNLGIVSAGEASRYLLGMAATLDGKPGRAALLPAMLADSSNASEALTAIASDRDRSRETRRSAISWLARDAANTPAANTASRALAGIARDANEAQTVRSAAVSALARLESASAITELVAFLEDDGDLWLARQAAEPLGRSTAAPAREALRRAVSRPALNDEVRAAAITALMTTYPTASDAAMLRDRFSALDGDRSRDALVTALAAIGGRTNASWILSVAGNGSLPSAVRRKAISLADRAGVQVSDVVALYDRLETRELREAALTALNASGTRAGTDKLLRIAESDTDVQVRRRAVSLLSRNQAPHVRTALRALVEK